MVGTNRLSNQPETIRWDANQQKSEAQSHSDQVEEST